MFSPSARYSVFTLLVAGIVLGVVVVTLAHLAVILFI